MPGEDIRLPSAGFWRDEIAVQFSYGAAPDDLRRALEVIGEGGIKAGRMITHRIALSDIQKGFALVAGAGDSMKVVIVPDRLCRPGASGPV
ncbi:MAG: hypothetical protein M0Z58_07475 [Nitrospiraceae bacterium]|nr:hypothetical protein [Nitrospiraceae bacterium]